MAFLRERRPHQATVEDDDEDPLDEQQQEVLIDKLRAQDMATNNFFARAFLLLPFLSIAWCMIELCTISSVRQGMNLSACIASLLSTAYILHYIPLGGSVSRDSQGPIERYMSLLNSALSLTLALAGMLTWRNGLRGQAVASFLPLTMFCIIQAARRQLQETDLSALQQSRYGLKGA